MGWPLPFAWIGLTLLAGPLRSGGDPTAAPPPQLASALPSQPASEQNRDRKGADCGRHDAEWKARAEGDDLSRALPRIASFDFGWSIALVAGWGISARAWDRPQPQGVLGVVAARVLYGTSWSLMLTSELGLAHLVAGRSWAWLSDAWYITDRLFGYAIPGGCSKVGAQGGCGLGLGSFSELRGRLRDAPIRISIGGGWIQGRHDNDARRTLMESTWVLSPLTAQAELRARTGGLGLQLDVGPGLFFGMHNAHVHPQKNAADELDVPWHEFVPLDGGAGAGLRTELSLSLGGVVSLDGDAVIAPFVGPSASHPNDAAAPLDAPRGDGPVIWRAASFGLSFPFPPTELRLGLRYWMAELSPRPITTFGHRAVMLRWDIPLRL